MESMRKIFYSLVLAAVLFITCTGMPVHAVSDEKIRNDNSATRSLSYNAFSHVSVLSERGVNKNKIMLMADAHSVPGEKEDGEEYAVKESLEDEFDEDELGGDEFDEDELDDFLDENSDEKLFDAEEAIEVADPLYYFNYAMYSFNDFLYFNALKPLASGYKKILPAAVRRGVRNFFHNLMFPVRLTNNLLQGKIEEAGREIEIFFINTTAGVAGFSQVAQNEFNLFTSNEDLGQTLGSYSIGDGFYIVLPVLGPSSLRDAVGRAGDYFLTPVNYVEPLELNLGIKALDTINAVSFRLGDYEILKKASFDPYTALKNAYFQNRREKIKQ